MSDANAEEPSKPAAFNLPDGARSETHAYPERPLHVLLATSGSVASVKAPLIASALLDHANVEIQLVCTEASRHFYTASGIEEAARAKDKSVRVWTDADEWTSWKRVGDPILHIELRRWADVILVAPLSANTLSKLSHGACDNLLTSLMRAIDPARTHVYVFPAMNTFMWAHPFTQPQLDALRKIGYNVVGPIGKKLACGDVGMGAMTDWTDIVALVVEQYGLKKRADYTEHKAEQGAETGP